MNTTFRLINDSAVIHQSDAGGEEARAFFPSGSLPMHTDLPEGVEGGGRAGQVLTGEVRTVEPGKDISVLVTVAASGASFAVETSANGSNWTEAGRWAINPDDAAAVRFQTDGSLYRTVVYMGNQAAQRVRAYSQVRG